MASGDIYSAIQAHMLDSWTDTPILVENENTLPNGVSAPPTAGSVSCWVSVELAGTQYSQQSIGASSQSDNRWDEEGFLILTLFVPNGSGSIVGRNYAKQLADIFRGIRLLNDQSLEFLDASIGRGSPSDVEGNWFQIPIYIQWRRWESPLDNG